MGARDLARSLLISGAVRGGLQHWIGRSAPRGRRLVQLVNLHATPRADADALRAQVAWVRDHFQPISFPDLERAWTDPEMAIGTERPAALFTFDDGFASQYEVAAPILEEIGVRGVFFVVPRFVECTGDAAWRFFTERIQRRPVSPGAARPHEDHWLPMSPSQVRDLAARGHTVGSHTLSHSSLRTLAADAKQSEIADSARMIAEWTGGSVDTFAWTFAWDTIDAEAWRIARRHHRYCFAPCTGTLDLDVDTPELIWRTHVEASYGRDEYRFMYLGMADRLWSGQRAKLCDTLAASRDGAR
jgi:peptidoglycan/xylan/chitin deacetylase (PgdA/CDA1 family)